MKEEVLNTLSETQKKLLNENRWAIGYLAKIEDVFINLCLQNFISSFQLDFINGLLEEECIDKEDYSLLKYLIETVDASRINYFMEMKELRKARNNLFPQLAQQAKSELVYMRDYSMKNNEIIFVGEYEDLFVEHNEIIPGEEYKLYSMKNIEAIPGEEYDKRLKKVYDKVMER